MSRAAVVVALCAALCPFVASGCAQRSTLFVQSPFEGGVEQTSCSAQPALERPLKVANYNIKSAELSSLDEIGDVLEDIDADVIALEEVDNGMERTGGADQSAELAERLRAERVFAGAWERGDGAYGIALLSRVPLVQAERFELPDAGNLEPRVGIDATVCAGPVPLRVVSTHADVLPWAATAHARFIAERVAGGGDTVVMGDMNATPSNEGIRGIVERGLADVLARLGDDAATFPATSSRIDYILTDRDVEDVTIVDTDASDHFPVAATLPLPAPQT